jgi:predicted glycogen debranching enzyme
MPSSAELAAPATTLVDFGLSSRLEWLETNGTGGYAMGTAAGVNTRRYHGHLVAAVRPPTERAVLLSKVDETAIGPEGPVELASNQYPGAVSPQGWRHVRDFRLAPFPTWTFDVGGGVTVEKRLFLVAGEQTCVIAYRASAPIRLLLVPFVALRDHHALGMATGLAVTGDRPISVSASGWPALRIHHGGAFVGGSEVYRNFEHLEELDRGFDFREDLLKIGVVELALEPERDGWLVATLGDRSWNADQVAGAEAAEIARRQPSTDDPLIARLQAAAEQFVATRADGSRTIVAGYPWFTDWGRDTMIALPGILLARGRLDDARQVIAGFLAHLDQGLIPNRFPDDAGRPEYNTADATLWLFQAAHAYHLAGGDADFVQATVYPAAREILAWHHRGTHGGIVVDPADGLLIGGAPGTQLTWMDARVRDRPATPRDGKAVEINALWYNALRIAAGWGLAAGDADARRYDEEAERVAVSFARAFWNPQRGCLYDVVGPAGSDERIRPNQLFAVALPYPLLTREQQRAVVTVVERELLTDVGLRTLGRNEPGYVGLYRGDAAQRDAGYHQGTVWPWLLGPYLRAYLRVEGRDAEALARGHILVEGIARRLEEGCLGTLGEIFDGDAPHRPGGAPAQAWTVGELLALLTFDLVPG